MQKLSTVDQAVAALAQVSKEIPRIEAHLADSQKLSEGLRIANQKLLDLLTTCLNDGRPPTYAEVEAAARERGGYEGSVE